MTLHKLNGIEWKYERKRICDEMPCVKLKGFAWFLFRKTETEWEYEGCFDTKAEMLAYAGRIWI